MVFNHSALNILRSAKTDSHIVSHDWWTYLLITGAGGVVLYDPTPAIYYRQHSANLIGGNAGWYARFQRFKMLREGSFKKWINYNCEALIPIQHVLTKQNSWALQEFLLARNSGLISRMIKISRLGVYRQTLAGSIGLFIGMLCNKI